MLPRKTCFLVLMLLILQFSTALPQGEPQDGLAFYLDSYQSFASVGQAFMGPLGGGLEAVTSLQVTNRDLQECEIGILFHSGVFIPDDFPVLINGEAGEFTSALIPRGAVRRFELTATGFLQGAVALGFRTLAPGALAPTGGSTIPCGPQSFRVTATSFVLDISPTVEVAQFQRSVGVGPSADLSEAFSAAANDADTWLCPGFCRAISTTEGVSTASIRQSLGIAVSSVVPGEAAPDGTQLRFLVYDAEGALFATRDIEVDGSHAAFFPGSRVPAFGGEGTMIFCLESSDPSYKIDLTVIRVNQLRDGTVQFDQAIFTDGFESGDVSAWGSGGN